MRMHRLIEACDTEAVESNSHFQNLIEEAQHMLGIDDGDCADMFDVNQSSVHRWRAGKAMPQMIVRRVVCRVIKERALLALVRHGDAEIAELKRQLELAKSDALIRPCAAPGHNYHQGGS